MSKIADFKARRQAERAALQALSNKATAAVADSKRDAPAAKKAAPVKEAKNEALTLLARLLGCEPENALAHAKELIETAEQEGFTFVIGFERTDDEQEPEPEPEKLTALAKKAEPEAALDASAAKVEGAASDLEHAAANVDDAAGTVNAAADNVAEAADSVNSAAGDLEGTAQQLAYSADDIGQATNELKEATAELKKPSAEPQSSRGAKAAAQKSSSKK